MIPIMNPEDFPLWRIRVIQEQRFPSAKIVRMWSHVNTDGEVIQVTADMQDGPVNHLKIDDAHIIDGLSLRKGRNDVLEEDDGVLNIDETYNIVAASTPQARKISTFLSGKLVLGRHAYLYWLDRRGSADPKSKPVTMEARIIAAQTGRRAKDVWDEISEYWILENQKPDKYVRTHRSEFIGEDPTYTEQQEQEGTERMKAMGMW